MIRGWCPTVHAPMMSGDGLLVRVKPFGGRLSNTALHALSDAVAAHGNGVVELTSRGNLQIRGVTNPPAFARAMVAAGLADADPTREARRNVIAIPPCDDALVAEAEAVMAETAGLAPKRFVVVDCGIWLDGVPLPNIAALQRALDAEKAVMAGLDPGTHAPPTPQADREGQPGDHPGVGAPWIPGSSPGMTVAATGHLLHLPFGQTDAATLARLAGLTPELRTTPWRAFLSPVAVPGFAEPGAIVACSGAPACASASVPARADAARLQAMGFASVHVSGCAKGCAHARPARTLVGRDGRYDLVRHGRASDPPDLAGLTLDQAAAAL